MCLNLNPWPVTLAPALWPPADRCTLPPPHCHNFHRTVLVTLLAQPAQLLCFVQKSHDFWAYTLLNPPALFEQLLSCTEITRFLSRHVVGSTSPFSSTIASLFCNNDCCAVQKSPDFRADTLLSLPIGVSTLLVTALQTELSLIVDYTCFYHHLRLVEYLPHLLVEKFLKQEWQRLHMLPGLGWITRDHFMIIADCCDTEKKTVNVTNATENLPNSPQQKRTKSVLPSTSTSWKRGRWRKSRKSRKLKCEVGSKRRLTPFSCHSVRIRPEVWGSCFTMIL